VTDPLFFRDTVSGAYVALDAAVAAQIAHGEIRV